MTLRHVYAFVIDLLLSTSSDRTPSNHFTVFNGDPHPGNCLELSDGRLGLIDFGQTRRLTDTERLALARVIVALGTNADPAIIAESMQAAGFVAKDNMDYATWTKYATLFFDSDMESQRLGFPTPQLYFVSLMEQNPLMEIPDAFGTSDNQLLRSMHENELTCCKWKQSLSRG